MDSKINSKIFTFDYSVTLLLISNIIVIILAVTQNWNLKTVLFIYLGQSMIIGLFNFIKIISLKNFSTERFRINNQKVEPTKSTKIFVALFFAFHYGLFHVVYFIFLLILNFSQNISNIETRYIFYALGVFFVNHLFSFYYNKNKDNKKPNIGKLMFSPYARIIPMHLIIIIGAFLSQAGIYSRLILVLFLILKTIADLVMHNKKHSTE
ncbi:MAG: DUF6498-containing protein [Nanoarchaeota archaeon]|nr:DUF6498-containing protein [Nanoarchaeota archaeon]